jgi:hypothetical protein
LMSTLSDGDDPRQDWEWVGATRVRAAPEGHGYIVEHAISRIEKWVAYERSLRAGEPATPPSEEFLTALMRECVTAKKELPAGTSLYSAPASS